MTGKELDMNDIPEEYFKEPGILNEKGLAKYKSGADMDIKGVQVEIEEPEPRRVE